MTPTCNHCGTKFPGRDFCKSCGQDPNSERTVADRIKIAVKKISRVNTPEQRKRDKALTRSIRNTASAGRKRKKHGRHV